MNLRHRLILDWLQGGEELAVAELAARLDVATMTVRRDLQALEDAGKLVRTHGGAVLSRPGTVEFTFGRRQETCRAQKQAIARLACARIRPGMAISLDTGTTTLAVARALAGVRNLRVLTSSLAVASVLYPCDGIELILLGGQTRTDSPDLYGELTEANLTRFHVDLAVLGADALTRDGLYTTHPDISRVSAAMICHAEQRLVVADSSKLGRTAFIRFAAWSDVDALVTDAGADAENRRWLEETGVRVSYAGEGEPA
jgi:DeoR/GlpR family transcriptional regulator of sugar metabolism